MTDIVKPSGRFVKGQSGNPAGRPPKPPTRHRIPATNRMIAFEVAEMPITIKDRNGGSEITTGYRGVILAMMHKALGGHAPSQKLFLEYTDRAAAAYGDNHALIQFLFRYAARLEGLVDAYEKRAEATKTGVLVLPQEEWDRRTAELNRLWEERKVRGFT